MSRCVACENWTLKPRKDAADPRLAEEDLAHARIGWGRCLRDELSRRWHPGESERYCDRHIPIVEEKVAERREWIQKQGKKSDQE